MADASISSSFHALSPRQRADIILSAARADMSGKTWKAALGSGKPADAIEAPRSWTPPQIESGAGTIIANPGSLHKAGYLDALLASIAPEVQPASAVPVEPLPDPNEVQPLTKDKPVGPVQISGPNAMHAPALEAAAQRTGVSAPALAAIIDAEAARLPDGRWNPLSRNPRSSAAGLGQFLAGTWLDMARNKESWLHGYAREHDMIDAQGKLLPGRRGALLALRYDPAASIEAVADYAHANIAHLRHQGITIHDDSHALSRAAYIGHHLGPGDATRFYRGTLSPERARHLLTAQIGTARAEQHIARSDSAAAAHRHWLSSYVSRHVRPERHIITITKPLDNL